VLPVRRSQGAPGTSPTVRGHRQAVAVALLTVDGTGREAIATLNCRGTGSRRSRHDPYSTFQAFSGSPQETPILEFDVDCDSTDGTTAMHGPLVLVPGATGSVTTNTWQTWDTITARPAASGTRVRSEARASVPSSVGPSSDLLLAAHRRSDHGAASRVPSTTDPRSAGQSCELGLRVGVDGSIKGNAAKAAGLDFGCSNETPTGSGSILTGPAGADGIGSAELMVDWTGGEALSTGVFRGHVDEPPLDPLRQDARAGGRERADAAVRCRPRLVRRERRVPRSVRLRAQPLGRSRGDRRSRQHRDAHHRRLRSVSHLERRDGVRHCYDMPRVVWRSAPSIERSRQPLATFR